jgi:hypothetical protein
VHLLAVLFIEGHCAGLRTLNLNLTGMTSWGAVVLSGVFRRGGLPRLEKLDLSGNQIDEWGAEAIIRHLLCPSGRNAQVKWLSLARTRVPLRRARELFLLGRAPGGYAKEGQLVSFGFVNDLVLRRWYGYRDAAEAKVTNKLLGLGLSLDEPLKTITWLSWYA